MGPTREKSKGDGVGSGGGRINSGVSQAELSVKSYVGALFTSAQICDEVVCTVVSVIVAEGSSEKWVGLAQNSL